MIDYFFRWPDEASAISDAQALANNLGVSLRTLANRWARDRVLPNVQVWRPSQDVGGVHTYLSGWSAIIAWPTQVNTLLNASALAFALDRDACNASLPFVIKNNIGTIITDVCCSPIFLGSNYPVGGYT